MATYQGRVSVKKDEELVLLLNGLEGSKWGNFRIQTWAR